MSTVRMVTIGEFLSPDQIRKCTRLNDVKKICEEVIKPNLEEINQKLGQENDPMYLAYMVMFAMEQTVGKMPR